jgi:O-antigen/teichoic acid export membrane protein
MLVASWTAVALVEFALLLRFVTHAIGGFEISRTRSLTRASLPFLGIEALIALLNSASVIILSKLGTTNDVGLFNAATQLLTPMTLMMQSVALSVFPLMCRRYQSDVGDLSRIAESAIAALFAFALVVVIAGTCIATPLLTLLYGHGFGAATPALRIVLWQLAGLALTSILGQVLFAAGRERITLRIVAMNTIATIAIGIPLTARFGVNGAALTIVAVKAVEVGLHYIAAKDIAPDLALTRVLWNPLVAMSCSGAVFVALRAHALIATVLAVGAYVVVFLAMESWASGGMHAVSARYQALWLE